VPRRPQKCEERNGVGLLKAGEKFAVRTVTAIG
jgi:hypothetical protein